MGHPAFLIQIPRVCVQITLIPQQHSLQHAAFVFRKQQLNPGAQRFPRLIKGLWNRADPWTYKLRLFCVAQKNNSLCLIIEPRVKLSRIGGALRLPYFKIVIDLYGIADGKMSFGFEGYQNDSGIRKIGFGEPDGPAARLYPADFACQKLRASPAFQRRAFEKQLSRKEEKHQCQDKRRQTKRSFFHHFLRFYCSMISRFLS